MIKQLYSHRIITIIICACLLIYALVIKIAPIYFYHVGKSALNKQNYIKAHTNLKSAYILSSTNRDIRYYYVQSLINLEPTETIQKELFEIATSKEQDSAQTLANTKVSEWRNNVTYNIGDNYIEQAPYDKGIIRWDPKKFPLKIKIEDASNEQMPVYYKTEIIRAFSQWQSSIKFLRFNLVDNKDKADILVKIAPLPDDVCSGNNCKYVVGYTNPSLKGDRLEQMTITLYNKDPFGNFFSDKELYNTILHEIGHSLGIMGHSYSSEDLMYMSSETNSFYAPYRSSFQYLSSKDVNTLTLLYKIIPTITNTPLNELNKKGLIYAPIILGTSTQISSRKLKEAQNYIKKAPDLSGGYIDLAIAYAELSRNNEAYNTLKKALKLANTNEEKYMIYYNLSALSMNMNKLEQSKGFALKAKELNNSEEVKELLMNINHAMKSNIKPFNNNLMQINETKI